MITQMMEDFERDKEQKWLHEKYGPKLVEPIRHPANGPLIESQRISSRLLVESPKWAEPVERNHEFYKTTPDFSHTFRQRSITPVDLN